MKVYHFRDWNYWYDSTTSVWVADQMKNDKPVGNVITASSKEDILIKIKMKFVRSLNLKV